jgi:hypothetical protein
MNVVMPVASPRSSLVRRRGSKALEAAAQSCCELAVPSTAVVIRFPS